MLTSKSRGKSAIQVLLLIFFLLVLTACGGGDTGGNVGFILKNVSPEDGFGTVSVSSKITAHFSQAIDKSSVTPANFWILDEEAKEKIKGSYEFSDDQRTITFTPAKLIYNRAYKASIYHSITSQSGTHLESGTKVWTFFTEDKPPIFRKFPDDSASELNTNISIRVEFENIIQSATLNSSTFILESASGPVPATVILSGTTGILTPLQELQQNSTYTATLTTNILNLDNSLAFMTPVIWSFTTRAQNTSTIQIGTAESDVITKSKTDAQGNLYIAGSTEGSFSGFTNMGATDGFIAKYNSFGQQQWLKQYGKDLYEGARDLGIGSDNNIYISGTSDEQRGIIGENVNSDITVRSHDANGTERWIRTFGSPDGHDFNSGLALDELNNIYVTGATMGSLAGETNQGEHDIVVAKYDSMGNIQWQKQFGTPSDETAFQPFFLNNSLYVPVEINDVVSFEGPMPPILSPQQKLTIYVISPNGTKTAEISLPSESLSVIMATTMDAQGNFYLAGMNFNPPDPISMPDPVSFGPKISIVKFSNTGSILWSKNWPEEINGETNAIAVDAGGNVFISAFHMDDSVFSGSGQNVGSNHLMLLKLDPNGNQLNMQKINLEDHASIYSLSAIPNGEIIATGVSHGGIDGNVSLGQGDGFIMRFGPDGSLR